MEPNKEAIAKWVEALESEEFQGRQIRGRMASPQGRKVCALGLRNLVFLREVEGYQYRYATELHLYRVNGDASRWAGLTGCELIIDGDTPKNVVGANDALGMTFPEIAQHLRKKYL